MMLLRQCGRTLFNVLLLRGRRRLAKFLVVLLVSAFLFVFGVSGVCMLDSAERDDITLQRARGEFEVSRDYVSLCQTISVNLRIVGVACTW